MRSSVFHPLRGNNDVITAQVTWEAVDFQPNGYQVRILRTGTSGCSVTVSTSRQFDKTCALTNPCELLVQYPSSQGSPFLVPGSETHLTVANEGYTFLLQLGETYLAQVSHFNATVAATRNESTTSGSLKDKCRVSLDAMYMYVCAGQGLGQQFKRRTMV